MKSKFVCPGLILSVIVMLLCSCNGTTITGTEYPDILQPKEGKTPPDYSQYIDDTGFSYDDCLHENTGYLISGDGHRLACSECRQPVEALQPHTKEEYCISGVESLGEKVIHIYRSVCQICKTPVEYLLSVNTYFEYYDFTEASQD